MCPTGHLEPGVVEAYSSPVSGLLDLGRYPSGVDRTEYGVAAALRRFDVRVRAAPGHHAMEVPEAVDEPRQFREAACGPVGRGSEVARLALREALACYEAGGIEFVSRDKDHTAARRPAPTQRRRRKAPAAADRRGEASRHGTGAIETDYLNGEIALLAGCTASPRRSTRRCTSPTTLRRPGHRRGRCRRTVACHRHCGIRWRPVTSGRSRLESIPGPPRQTAGIALTIRIAVDEHSTGVVVAVLADRTRPRG